ncbi:PhoH protein [Caulobacter phage Cr30]|uniref:PhoH protein n=1 Tax=Caulobacter phage Cr30 TaxID=1357714 RepID=UPI0004A9B701|nr:PhoH protein [Caulobacter phage Cr30]AGS80987.1 PhoH protein [Caulobacter phage Cr30]
MTARSKKAAKATNVVNQETFFALKSIKPITKTQQEVFDAYKRDSNLWLEGFAGCGKTLLALYLALNQIMNTESPYKKVTIVRSAVPTRDIGALPGDIGEKTNIYEMPYLALADELFGCSKAYSKLKAHDLVEFLPTSFIRGTTLRDRIVIVDEHQNLNFHENCSVITRLGQNTKIIWCGDSSQSDFSKESDKIGYNSFRKIIEKMQSVEMISFKKEDCVRSGLVKEFLLAKD